MTIEDTVARSLFPIAYAIAVIVTVVMIVHVARRYRSSPKRLPTSFGMDGRPRGDVPKQFLWLGPAIVAFAVVVLGVELFAVQRPTDQQGPILALVMIVVAETAALVIWSTDRQIEIARKQIFRVAPGRLFRTILPLLATLAVMLALAIQQAR